MKRSLLGLLVAIVLLFAVITALKRLRSEEGGGISGRTATDKARITAFWQTYHEATAARSQGDFLRAASLYQEALKADPDHEDSLYYLGNCFFEFGDYAEAIKLYRRITQLNSHSHRGFSQLGVALSTFAPGVPMDLNQAGESFLRSIEINREESGTFVRLGLLAFNKGHLEEAFERFNTAAGFRSPEGLFLAGCVRYQQQEYLEAMRLFQKVLEMNVMEKAISGRGVLSEGDVKPSATRASLTPLEAAGVKSLLYLYWSASQLGGYPNEIQPSFRLGPGKVEAYSSQLLDKTTTAGLSPDGMGRGDWGDYDGDGDLDLAVAAPEGALKLYRKTGEKLSDVSAAVGLGGAANAWDVVWGDFDGDGRLDLYVIRSGFIGSGKNALYRNRQAGPATREVVFGDVTVPAGLGGERSTARAAFWDYDRDGKMDLVEVGNAGNGQPALRLFRNIGEGRFRECSKAAGIDFEGNAVDCAIGDYNRDGFTDLLVLRWRRPLLLYENNSNGTFSDVAARAGLSQVGGRGLSSLLFDYDRDGYPDILIAGHAPYEAVVQGLINTYLADKGNGSRLFRNSGKGSFEEVTSQLSLDRSHAVMQAIAVDVDHDGWLDLVLANGGLETHLLEPSLVLRNNAGKRFTNYLYLPRFDRPSNAKGVAAAGFESEGRVDFYLSGTGLFTVKTPSRKELQ